MWSHSFLTHRPVFMGGSEGQLPLAALLAKGLGAAIYWKVKLKKILIVHFTV